MEKLHIYICEKAIQTFSLMPPKQDQLDDTVAFIIKEIHSGSSYHAAFGQEGKKKKSHRSG